MELRLRPNNLSVPAVYFIFHSVPFRSLFLWFFFDFIEFDSVGISSLFDEPTNDGMAEYWHHECFYFRLFQYLNYELNIFSFSAFPLFVCSVGLCIRCLYVLSVNTVSMNVWCIIRNTLLHRICVQFRPI